MPVHLTELQHFFSQHRTLRVFEKDAMETASRIADSNGFLTAGKLREILGNYARVLEKDAAQDQEYSRLTMLAITARKPELRPFDAHMTDAEWDIALDRDGNCYLLWDGIQHIGICPPCFERAPEYARKIKEAVDHTETEEEISRIVVPDRVIKAAQDLVKPKT